MDNFEIAWKFTKQYEGGYVFDKDDPGGETNLGVTDKRDGLADGKADVDGDGDGDVNIKDLNEEQAKAIYLRNYWEPVGGPNLPIRDAVAAFDCCVNCGLAR